MAKWRVLGGLLVAAAICGGAVDHAHAQQPTGTIEGRVVDALSGAPIEGVLVLGAGQREMFTDPDGRYRLEGVPAGPSEVLAADITHDSAHFDERVAVTVVAGQVARVDITLVPAARIRGVVTDGESGARLANVLITYSPASELFPGPVSTDADGVYEIIMLLAGDYQVCAVAPPEPYRVDCATAHVDTGALVELNVAISPLQAPGPANSPPPAAGAARRLPTSGSNPTMAVPLAVAVLVLGMWAMAIGKRRCHRT